MFCKYAFENVLCSIIEVCGIGLPVFHTAMLSQLTSPIQLF